MCKTIISSCAIYFPFRRRKLSREKLIVFHRPIRIVSAVVFCSARRSGASIQKLIVVNRSTSEGRASWNRPGGARVQSSKVSRGSLMKVISIQGSNVHFYSEILPQLSAPLRSALGLLYFYGQLHIPLWKYRN